jgi:hypothetical protein
LSAKSGSGWNTGQNCGASGAGAESSMRADKTVFIVGAGASNEVGIPFGREFLEIISQKLNFKWKGPSLDPDLGDSDILDAIQQHAHDRPSLNGYLEAAQRIREGILFSRSIDAFVDVHRDDHRIQKLGKLAIAKTILEQEQRCHMYIAPSESSFQDVARLNDSWFVHLARGLNEGVRLGGINGIFEKISFIVFNYDRCVEHLLYNALQKHHGIDATDARSVMELLRIFHPYGKIASLPWQGEGGIPFGFPVNRANLLKTAGQIKTYTEQIEDNETLKGIRQEIATAETLVFLGFSYLPTNMKILDPGPKCGVQRILGTAYGISASDTEEIQVQVQALVHKNPGLQIRRDLTCLRLLQDYSRTLFL